MPAAHQEAVARIGWIITERALGVVCGEVGAGKTVAARAASTSLDSSRHTIIYLPNPAVDALGRAIVAWRLRFYDPRVSAWELMTMITGGALLPGRPRDPPGY
jgi:type II secretory pathway predicted ATPase ExeA